MSSSVIGLAVLLGAAGCAAEAPRSHPTPSAPVGQPLDVVVNGDLVDASDGLWSAHVDGRRLVLRVPESTGCTVDVALAGVDAPSESIDVTATSRSSGACAANLFLSEEVLLLDTDVRGYTVRVRFVTAGS